MIRNVTFENFRGFQQLELENLSQITLLTGRNNAGKSSILEGIFLLMDHNDVNAFGYINGFRGLVSYLTPSSMWEPSFYKLNTRTPMQIQMDVDGKLHSLQYQRDDSYIPAEKSGATPNSFIQFAASGKATYTLRYNFKIGEEYTEDGALSINESGSFRNLTTTLPNNQIRFLPLTQFINLTVNQDLLLANMIAQMELSGIKERIVESLRIMEPGLSDVLTLSLNGHMQVYVKIRDRVLPIKLAGEGTNRLLMYLLSILTQPNVILLIDEIDSGIHYSVMKKMWKLLASAAKETGCQIIASTHSYECIDYSVDGISEAEMLDRFCLYRLDRKEDQVKAVHYPGELVKEAVAASMEVR